MNYKNGVLEFWGNKFCSKKNFVERQTDESGSQEHSFFAHIEAKTEKITTANILALTTHMYCIICTNIVLNKPLIVYLYIVRFQYVCFLILIVINLLNASA